MTSLVFGALILESSTPSVNVFLGVWTTMVVYVDIGVHGNFFCLRKINKKIGWPLALCPHQGLNHE